MYILKQWIVLNTCADWLLKFTGNLCLKMLKSLQEKMSSNHLKFSVLYDLTVLVYMLKQLFTSVSVAS